MHSASAAPQQLESASSELRRHKWIVVCAVSLIAFGIALRLGGYFANRSLWGDEVAIALNLRFRYFPGLLHRLDYEQTMPLALLMALKATIEALGTSEYAFRLPLLIAGCLLLPAMWLAYKRHFGWQVALISLGLAAISRPLIYYSSELKQYGLDALVTVITLWFGLEIFKSEGENRWRRLLAWGVIAVILSQPSIFILAAIGMAALMDQRFRTSSRWRMYCIIAALCWLGSFAVLYFASYRDVSRSPWMRAFWANSFIDVGSSKFREQFVRTLYVFLASDYFDHLRALALAGLFLVGAYGIWRRYGARAVTVAVGPYCLLVTAAMMKLYPIATRLQLFTFPLIFWIYASALVTIADFMPSGRTRAWAPVVLSVALFAPTAVGSVKYVLHYPPREATRQMATEMRSIDPAALVYLPMVKYIQWAYYTGDWHHPYLLQQRINSVFYVPRRTPQTFAVMNGEMVGVPPPRISEGPAKDDEWARSEAERIAGTHAPSVWIFLPVYTENAALGQTFEARRLMEKLEADIEARGARRERELHIGDSIGILYRFSNAKS